MACCGNRGNKVVSPKSSPIVQTLSGSTGMTILQYNGENYGKEPFFGPVTGAMYEFSKTHPFKNVDNQDLHTDKYKGLLDLTQNGRNIFSIKQPDPVAPVSAPVVEIPPVVESAQVVESAPVETVLESKVETSTVETPPSNTSDGTLIQKDQIVEITPSIIKKLKGAGISTWELFVTESSVSLSEITGLPVDTIDGIKAKLTSE